MSPIAYMYDTQPVLQFVTVNFAYAYVAIALLFAFRRSLLY